MHSCDSRLCVGPTQLQAPGSVWYACIMHTQLVAAHASETRHSACPLVASCGLFQSSMTSYMCCKAPRPAALNHTWSKLLHCNTCRQHRG